MAASESLAEMTAATELQRLRGQAVMLLLVTIMGAIGAAVLVASALVSLGLSPELKHAITGPLPLPLPALPPNPPNPPSPPLPPRPPDVRDADDGGGLSVSIASMFVMDPTSVLYPWVRLQS